MAVATGSTGGTSAHDASVMSVSVVNASPGALTTTSTVSGSIVAREDVLVGTESEGAGILSILVEEGDTVQEGHILAVLTSDLDEIALAMNDVEIERANALLTQSDSTIALAQTNLDLASKALARADPLSKSGVTSLDVLEQRQADVLVAEAKLATAQQAKRVALAERAIALVKHRELTAHLERTRIRAPAAGIIVERFAHVGDIATGKTPLFRIAKDGLFELEALVPMRMMDRIRPETAASIAIPGIEAPLAGTVRHLSPRIEQTTRMARVRIALPPTVTVRLGTFARAEIRTTEQMQIVLPLSAVQPTANGSQVQLVANGTVETRAVVTGRTTAEAVQIVSGISTGEQVILRSGGLVRAGMRVTPVLPAAVIASNL
ncbi:efflux RND transporter periplasmic adaptor subunit [Ensifer sp. HO-A22]|uniref:Efflux RND transporter periplasmic adaptor subunit n=1 Tax=Ensifer oleiphilus TaxID=2742698 RepID=A0A7Y6Q7G9_9HYPH|nr:efflux RND transporter periplasmic adaptor subunit [Ensifer oleiphilus]NVD40430.1 efflux RND transporter periplasmic adaptor subunit [Ensifer oleiphilus]